MQNSTVAQSNTAAHNNNNNQTNTGVTFSIPDEDEAEKEQQRQAMLNSVFTIGPSFITIGGNLQPAAKRLKQDDDIGFDALSMYKKLQLMSFSHASNANGISKHLRILLEQRKEDRLPWINTHALPTLIQKDPEAFSGFLFTATFADDICNGKMTAHASTGNWWDGIIGQCLRYSSDDIRNINALHGSRNDQGIHLQLNPNQLNKLSIKAPVPIDQMQELLYFLRRVNKIFSMFYPRSCVNKVAEVGYQRLVGDGTHQALAQDQHWCACKPREIVFDLVQIERKAFTHVLTERNFILGETNWYSPGPATAIVDHWATPIRRYTNGQLPKELRPAAPIELPPLPPPTRGWQSNDNTQFDSGRRTGTGRGRYGPASGYDPASQQQGPHTNPNLHQLFKQFWERGPDHLRRVGLARLLRASNTTTQQAVVQLGLEGTDCGNYHIRGHCRGCSNRHRQQQLDPRGIQQVITKLQQGQQQLN